VKLVLLGPPGAGKGTQAELLSGELKIPHISTGEMMREAIESGSEVGRKVKDFVEKGLLVPDDLMIQVVGNRLSQPDCKGGFILDGFPRTIEQAKALDDMPVGSPDIVVYLEASEDTIVERLSGRRTCRRCGANYHVKYLPPKVEGICDKCGGELYRREDDEPETIRKRLKVYREQTAGLIDYYRKCGLLVSVNADAGLHEVHKRILNRIGDFQKGRR